MYTLFYRTNNWPLGSALAIVSAIAITVTSLAIWFASKRLRRMAA